MIGPEDDFLLHQVAEPIGRTGTSDPNFFDRYYFNLFPESGDLLLIFGLGQYPNRGVTDAFVLVGHEDSHQVIRASRELRTSRFDTSVGPLGVTVTRGLRELKVTCEPNEWGTSFDLTWIGDGDPFEEPPSLERTSYGRIVEQGCRFVQTGSWRGSLTVSGHTYDVTPESWFGGRDRSWGVRPVGETERIGEKRAVVPESRWVIWSPIRFSTFSLYFSLWERSGQRTKEFCVSIPHDGVDGSVLKYPIQSVEIDFLPFTKLFSRARYIIGEPGQEMTIDVEPLMTLALGVGTGYRVDESDDWRHGSYQGQLVVEGRSYPLKENARASGVTTVSRFRLNGDVGMSIVDLAVYGDLLRPAHAGDGTEIHRLHSGLDPLFAALPKTAVGDVQL